MAAIRTIYRTSVLPQSTFWHLPIRQRTGISCHAYPRTFSSTVARKNELVDIVTRPPLFLLETLHAAHIPWWATIPLAAVLIRGVLGYHLGGKQAHRRQKVRVAVGPVINTYLSAGHRVYTHDATNARGHKFMEIQLERSLGILIMPFRSFYKYGGGPFGLSSFGNLALLITTAEAIRLKLGAHDGLLSFLLTPIQKNVVEPLLAYMTKVSEITGVPLPAYTTKVPNIGETKGAANNTGSSAENMAPAMSVSTSQGEVEGSTSQLVVSLDEIVYSVDQPTGIPSEVELSAYDPTTTLEGLSFCTDLTGPDASGILPATLFVVMVASIVLRPSRAAYASSGKNWLKSFRALDGFMLVVAFIFWDFVATLPAGIYLYLIASMVVGKLQTIWLNVTDTIPSPIKPCVRRPGQVTLPFPVR